MFFNSMSYAIFLPIVFIVYWSIPNKYRWILLLSASYYFYMSWNTKYAILLLFTTGISYFAGILLERATNRRIKIAIIVSAIVACISVLFVFKYYNFTVNIISMMFDIHPKYIDVMLPVGISFYTFQTISYVVDVYKNIIPAEKKLWNLCNICVFFSTDGCGAYRTFC